MPSTGSFREVRMCTVSPTEENRASEKEKQLNLVVDRLDRVGWYLAEVGSRLLPTRGSSRVSHESCGRSHELSRACYESSRPMFGVVVHHVRRGWHPVRWDWNRVRGAWSPVGRGRAPCSLARKVWRGADVLPDLKQREKGREMEKERKGMVKEKGKGIM